MKKILLIIFIISAVNLSASTIIVNSIYDSEKNPESFQITAAIEDGVMNTLFEYGFIMFSASNEPGYTVEGAKDARYMIRIRLLEDRAVSYELLATVNGSILESGVIKADEISGASMTDNTKLYYLMGEEIAAKLKQFF